MGIEKFWPTFGEGDVVNLFDLASKHIQDTGRPYRIAVDLPHWLFHNLDQKSAEHIRQTSQRASQPIEKAVLYRMIRLANHGIQVVLVVDGPQRPPKRNKITTQGQDSITERLSLLRSTAEVFGIPWWQAPGEAEAECAQMQRLGLVDAVWSEDSDTFLFKATTMFRFHVEGNAKSHTHVRSHCMNKIAEKAMGMDWRDLVLFAIIAGGDYDPKGLTRCGPVLALEAIQQGLGVSLVRAFESGNMGPWRQKFKQFLEKQKAHADLPVGFPSMQVLQNYIKPKVSSDQELRSGLSWYAEVDNTALRTFITSRYNFSVQECIKWVVPLLLTRRLLLRNRLDELALEFQRSVSSKESGNIPMSRISFLLPAIMPRHLLESWPVKITNAASRIKPYEHMDRIECDIPTSITKLAFPNLEELQQRPSTRIPKQNSAQPTGQGQEQAAVGKRKRGRPRKDANNTAATKVPPKNTDREELKEERAGRHHTGLESSTGNHLRATLSKGSLPHHHASESSMPSPQAEQSDDDFSGEDFPDLSELGQQRRTKYIRKTQPLDETTRNDLGDVTPQNTDHRQDEASGPSTAAAYASMHDSLSKAAQSCQSPRLSSNMAASARQYPRQKSCVARGPSQVIDLTED